VKAMVRELLEYQTKHQVQQQISNHHNVAQEKNMPKSHNSPLLENVPNQVQQNVQSKNFGQKNLQKDLQKEMTNAQKKESEDAQKKDSKNAQKDQKHSSEPVINSVKNTVPKRQTTNPITAKEKEEAAKQKIADLEKVRELKKALYQESKNQNTAQEKNMPKSHHSPLLKNIPNQQQNIQSKNTVSNKNLLTLINEKKKSRYAKRNNRCTKKRIRKGIKKRFKKCTKRSKA
jgi:hypothetical protein